VLATSHSLPLAVRDNLKARRLVQSEWYQSLWGDKVTLTGDQNAKTKFENTATGFRDAMAFKSLTGSRGDRVIIDDPLSVNSAGSEAEREGVNQDFLEAVPTRLNNPDRSAIVVVMQRLHERDVSGIILSKRLGYEHLMLPMEYEPERQCRTSIGFVDPRNEDGDLLFPARFPREVVERDKIPMGSYAVAGQFQQRPVPREGGLFKREWFAGQFVGSAPEGTRWVRHWDLAATAKATAARTAGVRIGKTPDGRYIVGHVVTTQSEGNKVRELIKATAETDPSGTEISLPQDPGQAGKVQKSDMVAMLAGYIVHAEREDGDKVTRAAPFSVQCEAHNVSIVRGEWNEAYLDELCLFPAGQFKDQVDASSGAFGRLVTSFQAPPTSSLVQTYRRRR
jgi:predicted phage terminase large subunit-like protein